MKKYILSTLAVLTILLGYGVYRVYRSSYQLRDVLSKAGFSEVNPPNSHIIPGTIVLVDKERPGIINTVCLCENAFGLEIYSKLQESRSVDIELERELNNSFEYSNEALQKFTSTAELKQIRKVSLKLSNVSIVEIPDDAIAELIDKRTKQCKNAIKKRKELKHQITLIKRVLKADAEYVVEFADDIDQRSQAKLLDSLSQSLHGKTSERGYNRIVGKELYWGIDDDHDLAQLQLADSTNQADISAFINNRPNIHNRATSLSTSYTVQDLQDEFQENPTPDLWLNAYAFLKFYNSGIKSSKDELIDSLGQPWKSYYESRTGLPYDKVQKFIAKAGLVSASVDKNEPQDLQKLFSDFGVMYISPTYNLKGNGKLLVDITSDKGKDTLFSFVDPITGKKTNQTYKQFIIEFNKEQNDHIYQTAVKQDPSKLTVVHFSEELKRKKY